MTLLDDLSTTAPNGTRVRFAGETWSGIHNGDTGRIVGHRAGHYGIVMDDSRGRPTRLVPGFDAQVHWTSGGGDFETFEDSTPGEFGLGRRVSVNFTGADGADVVGGDTGTIVREYSTWSGAPAWKVFMDNPRPSYMQDNPDYKDGGHWYFMQENLTLIDTPVEPVTESDELQAFRRMVVEKMQTTAASRLSSGQRAYIDSFLRDDLGLGDVLDGTAPGMTPPVDQMAVTFYVDVPRGQHEALREWVEAANPGARGVVVSYPGE